MSRLRFLLIIPLALVLVAGCASAPEPVPEPVETAQPEPAPEPPAEQPPAAVETVAMFAGEVPGTGGTARIIGLQLLSTGGARFQTDFLDGRLPLLETGTWEALDDGIALKLTGTRRLIYDEAREVLFEAIASGIIAVSYDSTIFGVRPMVLEELPVSGEPLLAETAWQLVSLPLRDASPEDPGLYTLLFDESGALSARADCNRFSGQFVDMDGSLRLSPLAMTRAACAAGSLSSSYGAAVSGAVFYTADDGVLTLLDEDGEPLAVLEEAK